MSKTPKRSAGLLMYRKALDTVEVFLVHPGGPYWSKKNEGSWTIPKGEYEADEEPLAAAIREFQEETGFNISAPFLELGSLGLSKSPWELKRRSSESWNSTQDSLPRIYLLPYAVLSLIRLQSSLNLPCEMCHLGTCVSV